MAQPELVLQHSLPKNAAPSASIPVSPSLRKVFSILSLSLTFEEILEAFDRPDWFQPHGVQKRLGNNEAEPMTSANESDSLFFFTHNRTNARQSCSVMLLKASTMARLPYLQR